MSRLSLIVAKTEVRRTVRAVSTERTKLLLMGVLAVVMLGPVTVAGSYLLPSLGAEFAGESLPVDAATITAVATGGVAVGWLFLVFMASIRSFPATASVDEPAFLLVSTPLKNTVIGVIIAEFFLFALWVVPPTLALSSAFAYGAGTVLPVPFALLVATVVLGSAVPVGFVVGICAKHLVTVYEPIARYRTILFIGFWVLYFGALATGRFDLVMSRLFTLLQDSPLGWPGHLLLAGIPNVSASSPLVLGAVVGTVVVSTAAVAVGIAAARIHWFADPARFDDAAEPTASESSSRLATVLSRGLSRPVRTVTVTAIRRTKRAPIRLAYVGYPLFGAIGFVQSIIQSGTVPEHVAVILSLYVVWAAGALFTLNPLGDLGRALPAVVTSTLTGRQAITGLVVAGMVVAAPIALAVSLVLGVVSPLSLEQTAVLIAGTVVGTAVTPALATGIGTAAPRFGSVNVTNNREAVMPSKTAFIIYSVAIILPTAAAVVLYTDSAALLAELIGAVSAMAPIPDVSVSARGLTLTAWTVLGIGVLAPLVSYFYAIERFDWYTLE